LKLKLSEAWLNRRADEHLPFTLAEENDREVGAPGRATYKVIRSEIKLRAYRGNPWLTLPVSAKISVCKPFGGSCFRYGSCAPRFGVSLKLAPQLSEDYALPPPEITSETQTGCRIGIDVTPNLEVAVEREIGSAQAQLNQRWPRVREYARAMADHQNDALELWPSGDNLNHTCMRLAALHVYQQPLEVTTSEQRDKKTTRSLTAALEVEGLLTPADNCKTPSETGERPLPPLKVKTSISDESRLHLPEVLSLDQLKQGLLLSFNQNTTASPSTPTFHLRTVRLGHDLVFLAVELTGSLCSVVWLSAHLATDSSHQFLVLRDIKPVVAPSPAVASHLLRVQSDIAQNARVELLGGRWLREGHHTQLLFEALTQLQDELNKQQLMVQVQDVNAQKPVIQLTNEGVYVYYPISARLLLSEKAPL